MTKIYVLFILFFFYNAALASDVKSPFSNSYAVLIGVKDYRDSRWQDLPNTENDVKGMTAFLKSQGFKVKIFVGKNATKRSIIAYLEDHLAERLDKNDRFLFYFSGHGDTRPMGGRDRGYLIPYDGGDVPSTWIGMEQLRALADKLGNAKHQLFILDACFGGSFATKSSEGLNPKNHPRYATEITSRRARQFLTAGGDKEEAPAKSRLQGYEQYSHYTAYLLKGLLEGKADTYPDGLITVSELNAYLGPAATTHFNTPRSGHFPGHELGEFVFGSPKPANRPHEDLASVDSTQTKGLSEKSATAKPNPNDEERDWQEFAALGIEGLELYLKRYPKGKYAFQAHLKLEEAKPKNISTGSGENGNGALTNEQLSQLRYEWKTSIRFSSSSKTVEEFLKPYPPGTIPEAEKKIEKLRAEGK